MHEFRQDEDQYLDILSCNFFTIQSACNLRMYSTANKYNFLLIKKNLPQKKSSYDHGMWTILSMWRRLYRSTHICAYAIA
jgi:hypothetical protein